MFDNIFGHEKQLEQISRAIASGKLHHALLLSGTDGIGKRRIALELADALGCSAFDRHEIVPDGNSILIDSIRRLKQKIFLHPFEGEVKTVLIDPAHLMTDSAANALLKILEEPPASTFFFLVTPLPSRLLPTILSRCQKISFSPLPEELIRRILEKEGVDSGEAKLRARTGQGSLRAALDFDAGRFAKVQKEWYQLSQNPTPTAILDLAKDWGDKDCDLDFILQSLQQTCHRQMIDSETAENLRKGEKNWTALQQATRSLERTPNRQLLVEDLLFQLTA